MCVPERATGQDIGESTVSEIKRKKKELRRSMLRLRNEMDPDEKAKMDLQLAERFLALDSVQKASTVYVYLSYGTEIATSALMERLLAAGKSVAAPRVDGSSMAFYLIRGMQDTERGYKGIPEPGKACRKCQDKEAVMLMPGLAFTADGDRIGYGGGFYDRFLSEEPDHPTIALGYPFQLLDELPTERHDHMIDEIILPDRKLRCR